MTAKTLENGSTAAVQDNLVICTLNDGRVVTQINEDDLSTDVYFRFQKISVQHKNSPEEALRWLMVRLFLVDGQPLTIDQLSEKPPVGIGFRAAAQLGNLTSEFLKGLPSPKTSSTLGDLAGGDLPTFEN